MFRCFLIILAVVLVGCSSSPAPTPTPIPLTKVDLSKALLQAEDLTLGNTMRPGDWVLCPSEAMDKALAKHSAGFSVVSSKGISWAYGTSCKTEDSQVTIYEYIWIAQTEREATRLTQRREEQAKAALELLLPVTTDKRITESRRESASIKTLRVVLPVVGGFTTTEIVAQHSEAVIELAITNEKGLVEDDYMDMIRAAIAKLQKAQQPSGK